jgi:3-hydroxyisobutyrate dehydrogenase-like beta-hydroxyacid dehydrogenase
VALDGRTDRPVYVDANAVSPATVAAIAELLGPEHVVDGSVIGPPAWERGSTLLWLAGAAAAEVAALFHRSPFEARVLGPDLGAASALKACLGLHSEVVDAVWPVMDRAATAYGVGAELREELRRSGFDLDAALARFDAAASGKARRLHAEMEEAGDALAAVDLPDGFSRAAARVYRGR